MKSYDTLSQAINSLKSDGYSSDFNLHPDWIECPATNVKLKPDEFHIDSVYRFEGMSNPDDNSVLYAISSRAGLKGVLVDAYGVYADSISQEMIGKLKIDYDTRP
jgi:hypothetical protein